MRFTRCFRQAGALRYRSLTSRYKPQPCNNVIRKNFLLAATTGGFSFARRNMDNQKQPQRKRVLTKEEVERIKRERYSGLRSCMRQRIGALDRAGKV